MSGDWGGGWAVAVAGLGAAVRAGDGRGPSTALRDLVAVRFGNDPESVAIAADRGEISEADLHAFAPVVFAAALDGDPVAVGIVDRLADEVLSFVRALVDRMDVADCDVDVVLGGGTLQSGHPLLLDRIRAGRARCCAEGEAARSRRAARPRCAVGALASAGAPAESIDRARSHFLSRWAAVERPLTAELWSHVTTTGVDHGPGSRRRVTS